jgi:hypothetical protein
LKNRATPPVAPIDILTSPTLFAYLTMREELRPIPRARRTQFLVAPQDLPDVLPDSPSPTRKSGNSSPSVHPSSSNSSSPTLVSSAPYPSSPVRSLLPVEASLSAIHYTPPNIRARRLISSAVTSRLSPVPNQFPDASPPSMGSSPSSDSEILQFVRTHLAKLRSKKMSIKSRASPKGALSFKASTSSSGAKMGKAGKLRSESSTISLL